MNLHVKIILNFQTKENIVEAAVDDEDNDEKGLKEADQEEAENGSKGIEEIDDEENNEIDINPYLLLVWACDFRNKYPCLNCDDSLL